MKKEISGRKLIFSYVGIFSIIIGLFLFFPLVTLIFYHEEIQYVWCFVVPGLISITLGYIINMFFKNKSKGRSKNHEDAVLVLLFWIMAIIICGLPFLLTGKYNFVQSIFETTSGLTT